jgi:hypothetical protein
LEFPVMRNLSWVFVLLAAPNFAEGAPPTVITTRSDWTSLLQEFGVDPIESPASEDGLNDGLVSSLALRNAGVYFYDPRQTRPADQARRERFAAQGTVVAELRDSLRSNDRLRRRAVAVRIHAALVQAMPERKLDLDARLRDLLRRCFSDSASIGPPLAGGAAIEDDPLEEGRTETGRAPGRAE